jgi:uncharacterized protein YqgC (DUF456 family)
VDIGASDNGAVTAVAGLIIVIGLAGVVVPFLPGLPLVWGGVLLWALVRHDGAGWVTLAVATVLMVAGTAAKYALPGRRLREAGVPWSSLLLGGVLGVVGFFVIPVVGAVLGFVLGVYLAERLRLGGGGAAWPSTRSALGAVGWSIALELLTGLLIAAVWVAALIVRL